MALVKLNSILNISGFARLLKTLIFGFLLLFGFGVAPIQTVAQTYYSRNGGGNWGTNGTWSTVALNGATCGCTPTAGNPVIIGNNDAVTWVSGAPASLSISSLTIQNTATLTFGNGGTTTTLTVTGDIVISGTGKLQSGNTGGTLHTINLGGNLTNAGTLDLTVNNPTFQLFTFTGTGKSIGGSGTFNFNTLNLATSSPTNLTVSATSNISISSNLSFSNDGILAVGSNSNIVIGVNATISGNNGNRYIQLDGLTGTNSNLIKTTAAATSGATSWAITYPIGTSSGGYTPVTIPTVTNAPTNNSTLSIKAIYSLSNQGQLRRTFRFVVAGNAVATTTFTNGAFNYNNTTDISSGDAESNYTTEWYLQASTSTAAWTNIATIGAPTNLFTVAGGSAATASLATGTYYYTIGQSSAYPNTWYSYQTGVWSNWQNWTSDPSGSSLVNGLNLPPQPGDAIVILNGITITNDVNGQVATSTIISSGGTLDMSTTTGNTLGTVSGVGLLRVGAAVASVVALPTGNYASLVAAGTGGTIEYYNATSGSYTLPTAQTTYNNLILSTVTSNVIFVETNNLTINNDFDITSTSSGTVTWQINDNTGGAGGLRTITIAGDLTVSANGKITAGTGRAGTSATQHSLTLSGNLTNNGIIQFFDPTQAPFTSNPWTSAVWNYANLQGNAVNVTFSGSTNALVTCNNQTDFYRLILNKGTGQQAMLTVNSSSTSNFRFFGPSNIETTNAGNTWDFFSNNALSIMNGTLQLTGSINIPVLQVSLNAGGFGYFPIPRNGALWLNGTNVTVQLSDNTTGGTKDGRILMSGLLRVTAGTINAGFGKGLGSQDGGTYFQEGGTVNCWQFRPKATGSGIFSFVQTGGTLNVGYQFALSGGQIDGFEQDFCRFDLASVNSTFQMSGSAILNVAKPTLDNPAAGYPGGGLFHVGSSAANFNVTGGTINLYLGLETASNSYPGYITSTAGLYNVNIYKESTTAQTAVLRSDLVVLNNLSLLNNTVGATTYSSTLATNNFNVSIGGNFIVDTGGGGANTYTPGTNTTTFNGSGAQTFTNNGTISTLAGATVVVNKSAGVVTLAGSTSPIIPADLNKLTLTSGTLADGGSTVTVNGTLTNYATHTSTGLGSVTFTGTNAIVGNNGTFGNLIISANNSVSTSGTQTVTGNLRLTGANSTLNIGSNALTVLGGIYDAASPATTVAFTGTKRILTSGLHNAGGLTRKGINGPGAAGDILFPVGSAAVGTNAAVAYTPVTINVTATTQGTITVRPVNSEHPNVTTTGQSLNYYWNVTSSGYSTPTAVSHKTYTFSTAVQGLSGPPVVAANTYRAARYDRSLNNWSTNNSPQTMGTKILPDPFNTSSGWTLGLGVPATDQLDGEYTCGNIGAFGSVTTYYSRASTAWNVNTTWSTVAVGGAAASSNPTSCPTCPVIIGDGTVGNGHKVTCVAASSCGSLTISANATLDCSTFTGHNFGTSTGGVVSGTGTLRIAAVGAAIANMFPAGDFTNFLGVNGGTVEWYGNTKTLPATGPGPQNLSLSTYYNLSLNPTAGQIITMPASSLTIYNNMGVNTGGVAGTIATDATTASGANTLTVNNILSVGGGTFNVMNNGGNTFITKFVVNGSTINAGTFQANGGNNSATPHTFTTSGSITQNGNLYFLNGTAVVNLIFSGSNSVNVPIGNSARTYLNKLNVNLGTSQTPILTFSGIGQLATPNTNWLTLTNGTIHFNMATTSWTNTVTIENANSFTIPSTTSLKVSSAIVNVIAGSNSAYDLFLNGKLEVAGATVNIAGGTSGNDIEYAAAGTPTIIVSSGSLNVNGSIRRSATTITGALVYNQTGGIVTVSGNSSDNTRGVFEIDYNTGSSFTLTGNSALAVQRQTTGGTGYTDIFINPITSNVSSTSTITAGLASVATNTNFRINIAPFIGNFIVDGGANAQTVKMYSNPMVLAGSLTITSPSSLNTNPLASATGLDVSIAGNLNMTGTASYLGGANTTTFNGTGAQSASLTASPTAFNNLTVSNTGGGTVTLSGTAPALNNLNILSGVLDVGSMTLQISGNITNNSKQISTGGAGALAFASAAAAHTITSSNGIFNNLTLGVAAGPATKLITVNGNMTITGTLDFTAIGTSRYLFIGSSLLTFQNGVAPDPVSTATILNAGNTRFIKTNGVSSDLGVTKVWPTGTNSFTYPVGTRTNYTPVIINNLVVTTAGNYRVVPVDAAHPTSSPSGSFILDYYWKIIRDNSIVHGATGTLSFQTPGALIGGANSNALIGAYLDAINLVGWTSGGTIAPPVPALGSVGATETLTFTNSFTGAPPTAVLPASNGEFDYTYGTTLTLPNPVTPVYSRFADADHISNPTSVSNLGVGGSWAIVTSWTLATDGYGAALGAVPTGRPMVILPGARINLDIVGQNAFTTTISGLLVVTTTGHNIGTINNQTTPVYNSTGIMRTTQSTLPAGTYNTIFTAAGGGTIEYAAAIPMSNQRDIYNNLLISSTVSTVVPVPSPTGFTVNGNLTIGSGNTLNNSANIIISLLGNWSNSGTYTGGTGTVSFNGTAAQTITGATTFSNLTINNTFGTSPQITLSGNDEIVSSTLTMTKGNINLNTRTLTIGTSAASPGALSHSLASTSGWMYGGNLTRYFSTSTFAAGLVTGLFPMGISTDFRPFFIGVTAAPSPGGSFTLSNSSATNTTIVSIPDPTNTVTTIVRQHQGSWSVATSGIAGGTYDVIAGGTGFGTIGSLADVTLSKATAVVGTYVLATTNSTSDPRMKRTELSLTDFTTTGGGNQFFVGSTNALTSPLPIELLSFTGDAKIYGVDLQWKTASEMNSDYFTVLRSSTGAQFESIGTVKGNGTTSASHSYLLTDYKPLLGKNYYQLKQTDFDGRSNSSETIVVNVLSLDPLVSIYPNPLSSNQLLNVEVNGLEANTPTEIQVISTQGTAVKGSASNTDSDGTLKTSIELTGLSAGLYILKVQNVHYKFVIE